MIDKKQNGQFFTKNSDYILNSFSQFIKNKTAVDPFAGNKDLIEWAKRNGVEKIIGYDVDPKYIDNKAVFYNDSIINSKKYKFIITNPPYLHKNKAYKEIKEKYFSGKNVIFEDLYQASIFSILNCEEGIIVVPLNFLCAENSHRIRSLFFDKFEIIKLNIFSEQVFDDTTYNVISFYFKKKEKPASINKISATIFPGRENIDLILEERFNWQFGGDFVNRVAKTRNQLGIYRLTENYLESGEYKIEMALQNIKDKINYPVSKTFKEKMEKNIIFLRAIDSKNGKKIQLEDIRNYDIVGLVGKNTSRNMAHLIFEKELPVSEQVELMNEFNRQLNRERNKYFSFFLTNFRDNNRKRISFDMAYKFLNYIYNEKIARQSVLL
ncbi:MAG: hypothetical protein US35_C0007G0003 [Parcubacteria group bacterium GW2011_GWA2_37_10]|nr:MAG: hypothetical protein US35_C0007G0003 [Parcubacteria group bacterium GW2011_GWA2_37_10]HLD38473.1 hypothetical protein [Candidatus Nanoarchaeia archaeon]